MSIKTLLSLALLSCLYLSCSLNKASIIKPPLTISTSTTDRYNNAVTDDFWTAPQKPYEQRRNLYLKYSSANAQVEGRDAVFPEIAKIASAIAVDEGKVRSAIAFVYTGRDCNDFTIGGLVRLMYLNKKYQSLSPRLVEDIEKCLLDFKYWWDEPIKDIQYRCYHTENHQALYHTDELLAGQLLKDKTFKNGKKGNEHIEHALLRLERWLNFRTQFGFSEWLSNSYYDVDLMTLSNLYDFAEDPGIRDRAGLLMDVLMYDMSLNNYKGVFGSTHGRAYANSIKSGWNESTSSITKLMFGVGVFNSPRSMGAVSLATSSYRCPEIIESIATDYSKTIRSRQRQSIDVDDAEKYGLSYTNELDTHLFWGMQEFIHPKVVQMSQKMSAKYDTWPYKNYDYYIKEYENQVKNFGKIINPNLDQFALSEANIETYRTPDYMLSCTQDYRKGSKGYQQHIWQATLGVDAVVFTNHPGSRQENVTPNLWAGNVSMPRAAQFKNVLVSIYHIPPKSGQPYSHAYFPKAAFDEVVEKGNWVFGRKNNGYVALYSQNPTKWGADKDGLQNELLVSATDNVWVCEMGSKEQWKSFAEFITAISAREIKSDSLSIAYTSPSVGMVEFGWSQPFTIAGKNVPLSDYPRFENQFSQTAFTAKQVLIKNKKDELIIDFEKGKRIVNSNRNTKSSTALVSN